MDKQRDTIRTLLKAATPDCNLVKYAESELGDRSDKEGMDAWMHDHLLDMIRLFSLEGHSGFSAQFALGNLKQLLDFKPLSYLTGDDNEWRPCYGDNQGFQNKRMSSVFKDENGVAYWMYGYIFEDENGARFSSKYSSRIISFPFDPTTESIIVHVDSDYEIEQLLDTMKEFGIDMSEVYCLNNYPCQR